MPLDPKIQAIIDRLNSRSQGSAEAMVIAENQMVELKVSELRTICESNPTHQSAAIMLSAIAHHQPGEKVCIEAVQIDAITNNKQVVTTIALDDEGKEIEHKTLADV